MATSFPTSLQDLDATRGTTGQPLGTPSHITHHTLEDDTTEALEAKVGIDGSAVTSSLDYKLKNSASIDPGHHHTNTSIDSLTEAKLTFTDITTNNVVSTKHGFAPKSPADATKFLNGAATPDYALVKDSDLSTSDITTNDASSSKHGFAPKYPNDATKYLNGTGAYTVPSSVSHKNGTTTYDTTTASGTQSIPHGLGLTPLMVRITVMLPFGASNVTSLSNGCYNGTTNSCVYNNNGGTAGAVANDNSNGIRIEYTGNFRQTAVITVDATNIILTWTKAGTPLGTAVIMWEVEA